jgi:uncharacterized protein YbaP (TraB family)
MKKTKKPRKNMLCIMLSEEERAEIEKVAQRVGIPASTWARMSLLTLARQEAAPK